MVVPGSQKEGDWRLLCAPFSLPLEATQTHSRELVWVAFSLPLEASFLVKMQKYIKNLKIGGELAHFSYRRGHKTTSGFQKFQEFSSPITSGVRDWASTSRPKAKSRVSETGQKLFLIMGLRKSGGVVNIAQFSPSTRVARGILDSGDCPCQRCRIQIKIYHFLSCVPTCTMQKVPVFLQ